MPVPRLTLRRSQHKLRRPIIDSGRTLNNPLSIRPRLAWPLLAVSLLAVGLAQAARPVRVHALTHAKVIVRPGEVIDDATLVLRDGLIESVRRAGAVPSDAVEIDLTDHWVHAAFLDADTTLEIGARVTEGTDSPRRANESPEVATGAVHDLLTVRPETRARDLLRAIEEGDRQAERMRELGFATVLVAPADGLFRGRSCLISIASGRPVAEIIARDDVAQHVSLERGGFGGSYPTSLMGAVAAVRQTLHDSRRQMVWRARYDSEPRGMQRPPHNDAFEALAPLLRGEQPLVVEAQSPQDAMLAHRTAAEFDLSLLIAASGYEWEIAEQLARTGRALLYPVAFPDKPKIKEEHQALDVSRRELRRYLDAASGPARLRDAGVSFALTTQGLKNLSDFSKNLQKIAEAGLTPDEMLAALTTTPATLLGVSEILGAVAPGMIGSLVVTDGPPFAEKTRVTRLFIDGIAHEFGLESAVKGDPDAVVDPRGEWSVRFEMGSRSFDRVWTIEGEKGDYRGRGETQRGIVDFDSVTLVGNALTVVLPDRGGGGSMEITVIIEGDSFEGTSEFGSRTATLTGNRSASPDERR